MTVEYIGPFEEERYEITVDGYRVPHIRCTRLKDGTWSLCLDQSSYAIDVKNELELMLWLPWVAEAMAIAAGYTCFGEHSKPANVHKRKMIGLSAFDIEDIKGSDYSE